MPFEQNWIISHKDSLHRFLPTAKEIFLAKNYFSAEAKTTKCNKPK